MYSREKRETPSVEEFKTAARTMRKAFDSVRIVFSVAPISTVYKLLQQAISAAMAPLSLFFTQQLVNTVALVPNGRVGVKEMAVWIALLLIAGILSDNINYIGSKQTISIQKKLNDKLTAELMAKLRRIDYRVFEDGSSQNVFMRMGKEPQQKIFYVFQGVTDILASLITSVGLAILVAQISIWLALGLLLLLAVMVYCEFLSVDISVVLWESQAEEDRRLEYLTNLMSERDSVSELKLFGAFGYIKELWASTAKKTLNERITTSIKAKKYSLISDFGTLIWAITVTAMSLSAFIFSGLSIGAFVSLVGTAKSVANMKSGLEFAFTKVTRFQLELDVYQRFTEMPERQIITREHDTAAKGNEANKGRESFCLSFHGVEFSYPNSAKPILRDVSFEVNGCERVALVGENGSGKSTIVKLLCRLYRPQKGDIKINGKSIYDFEEIEYQKLIGCVFQDFCRFELTLRENVALGRIEYLYDNGRLRSALRLASFESPDVGIDSVLGKLEDGAQELSGGQWQRVALARAFVSESDFLILDEPTAALDPLAESEMYDSFARVMEGKTCLMISHRLASARMCDKIVVIKDGTIEEEGDHSSLLKADGYYCGLFKSQSSWYTDDKRY